MQIEANKRAEQVGVKQVVGQSLPEEPPIFAEVIAQIEGFGITIRNQPALLQMASDALQRQGQQTVGYLNIHVLHQARKDLELRRSLMGMDQLYCDSDAIRKHIQSKGGIALDKLTSAGFYDPLCDLLRQQQAAIYLLGSKRGVAEAAAIRLRRRHRSLEFVGAYHGFFHESESRFIVERINASGANVLFVGTSTPKQENWVQRYRHQLRPKLIWTVGSMFSYAAGFEQRAPNWMLDHNLEWLFRCLIKPRARWQRALIEIPGFYWHARRQS